MLALTTVAAAVTIVLVRRANESDTIDEARITARAGARTGLVQIRSQLDEGGEPMVPSLLVLIELLQRSLAIQDAEIVRISPDGVVPLTPESRDPRRRLPVTGVPVALLEDSRLSQGVEIVRSSGDVVVVASPVPFTATEAESLRLEDDVVAVVATRRLGPAGLGSAGTALLVAAVVGLLVAAVLAAVLARRIRRPLEAVVATTHAISTGDLSARVNLPARADRELTEVARTVDAMAARLHDATRERERFLVDVSHELRTPLTSIAGYAELLADERVTAPEEVQEAGAVVAREAERLRRLTDDLLTQARLDAGEMTVRLEPVDLALVTEEVVAAHRPAAAQLGVELVTETRTLLVEADPGRLHQVITNLIDNALGFATGEVRATLTGDGRSAELVVADDGPGLGSAAASVFERTFSTDRPRDRRGSAGVGLSVVAGLVATMGGHVTAADGEVGARFTVAFPLLGQDPIAEAVGGRGQATRPR